MAGAAPKVGNLPADTTSFVGRRQELARTRDLLSKSRLVTLTGLGGVGKTRLALQVAAGVRRAFRDGVWLVDLTKLSGPRLLAQAVAEAVEIRETSRRDPLEILTDHFRDRELLLVLDNCEHVLEQCAELTDALLKNAPGLRILVTSRHRLNIGAESILAVPPLSLPEASRTASGRRDTDESEGVTLFADRATAAQPDFVLDADNRAVVEGICRRLDGLPLAIELAAARIRTLSPEQILARLDNRYRLLTTGPRDVPRHQTLQSLIDWSFELCSNAERLLWARSSVFAGPFGLEAAEAVCCNADIAVHDVVGLITGLIDKSILHREPEGRSSRYRQNETIREYGRERLADLGETEPVRQRHSRHYQRIAALAAREQFGPRQVEWSNRLRLDHADLRAALEHCAGDPTATPDGLRLAADLLYHWISSYYLNEGRSWLDDLLALDAEPTLARVDALWVNSWLALIQADIPAAKSMLAEGRALATQLGAESRLGYIALFSGMAAIFDQDTAGAIELYAEALQRCRATGNRHGEAMTLIRSAMARSHLGDSAQAVSLAEDCIAVCDAAGDTWHKSYALTALGIEMWRQGHFDRAAALEKESLALNRALDDRLGIMLNLDVLALAACSAGSHQNAARLLGALESLRRSLGVSLKAYTHLAADHDACVRQLTEVLGEHAYHGLLHDGAGQSVDEILDLSGGSTKDRRTASGQPEAPGLTRREWQIAELVAQGMSNKEIASSLTIALRTAESHVEHILVKLGFTSRTRIIAWVNEQANPPAD